MVEIAAPAARIGVVGIPEEDALCFRHSVARRKGLDVLMVRRANLTLHRALQRLLQEKLPLRELANGHWPLAQCQQAFEVAAGYGQGVLKAILNP
jgi:L-iditol 2-dehydrogenase